MDLLKGIKPKHKQEVVMKNMNDADLIELGFSLLSIVFIIGVLVYWFI